MLNFNGTYIVNSQRNIETLLETVNKRIKLTDPIKQKNFGYFPQKYF